MMKPFLPESGGFVKNYLTSSSPLLSRGRLLFPQPPRGCPFVRRIQIPELPGEIAGRLDDPGAQGAGQVLEREISCLDLAGYGKKAPSGQQKRESGLAAIAHKACSGRRPEFFNQPSEEIEADKWHVTREEQRGVLACGFERRIYTPQRPAAPRRGQPVEKVGPFSSLI